MTGAVGCHIDNCRNAATLVIESHPDDFALCAEHRGLRNGVELQPWEMVVLDVR